MMDNLHTLSRLRHRVPCTCQATDLAPERHLVTQKGKRPGKQSRKVATVTFPQDPSNRKNYASNFTVLTLSICFTLMWLRQVGTKFEAPILEVRLLNLANAVTCVAASRPTNAGRRFQSVFSSHFTWSQVQTLCLKVELEKSQEFWGNPGWR